MRHLGLVALVCHAHALHFRCRLEPLGHKHLVVESSRHLLDVDDTRGIKRRKLGADLVLCAVVEIGVACLQALLDFLERLLVSPDALVERKEPCQLAGRLDQHVVVANDHVLLRLGDSVPRSRSHLLCLGMAQLHVLPQRLVLGIRLPGRLLESVMLLLRLVKRLLRGLHDVSLHFGSLFGVLRDLLKLLQVDLCFLQHLASDGPIVLHELHRGWRICTESFGKHRFGMACADGHLLRRPRHVLVVCLAGRLLGRLVCGLIGLLGFIPRLLRCNSLGPYGGRNRPRHLRSIRCVVQLALHPPDCERRILRLPTQAILGLGDAGVVEMLLEGLPLLRHEPGVIENEPRRVADGEDLVARVLNEGSQLGLVEQGRSNDARVFVDLLGAPFECIRRVRRIERAKLLVRHFSAFR